MNNNDEDVIDLLEIALYLLQYLWAIILAAVVLGGVCFCYSKFVLPEEYTSTTEVYVLSSNTQNNSVNVSDLQVGAYLTKDFSHLITTRDVLEQVLEEHNLDEKYNSFKNRITVTTPKDTRIISISVTDTDPRRAQALADSVRETASEHIKNVMAVEAVNVASVANLPYEKSGPSVKKYTLIGCFAGAGIVIAFLLVVFILDDTIKTSDDVEKYLELSTLGMIPLSDEKEKRKRKKAAHRHSSQGQRRVTVAENNTVEEKGE